MAFDISKSASGVIAITTDTTVPTRPQVFVKPTGNYYFNQAGDNLYINFGSYFTFNVAFANLTIQGTPPANVAAAYTALVTVFS